MFASHLDDSVSAFIMGVTNFRNARDLIMRTGTISSAMLFEALNGYSVVFSSAIYNGIIGGILILPGSVIQPIESRQEWEKGRCSQCPLSKRMEESDLRM